MLEKTDNKICTSCKCETDDLFAPFDSGKVEFCSDCQMEAENDIQDHEEYQFECGVGPHWEGCQ